MNEEKFKQRFKTLIENKDKLEQVLRKEYRDLTLRKKSTNFFDSLYENNYDYKTLEKRPFLNVGPGSFRHKYWRTADKYYEGATWTQSRRGVDQPEIDYEWDIYDQKPLPLPSCFLEGAYCSHVIEHAFDEDVKFLFKDIHRILKPGGVFRIICPDADLLAEAYTKADWSYFFHYLTVKTERRRMKFDEIEKLASNGFFAEFVLEWVSLLNNRANPTVFKGKEAAKFLDQYPDKLKAFSEASRLSSRELNKSIGGHVNWFNFEKTAILLEAAGFRLVKKSGYLQSTLPILRDINNFDKTDPEMSLFIDAIA